MTKNKAIIILSGYNPRAILAFIRICKRYSIPFYVIANGNNDQILRTLYYENVAYIRENPDLSNLLDITIKIMLDNSLDEVFFLPSTEYLNRYLVEYHYTFQKYNIHVPLVDKKLYERISDKYSFRKLCLENNIPVTKQYSGFTDIIFPCVLKPKNYRSYSGKPIVIKTKDDFPKEFDDNVWFIEEYISGDSYYLLYYFKKDGTYLSFSQKNIIQQPNGGSVIFACSTNLHYEVICRKYADLFQKEEFTGLVMIEIKEKDGQYILIEANPRLWGPSQLFVDAGIRFFEEYITDMGFNVSDEGINKQQSETYYFWEGGFPQDLADIRYYSYDEDSLIRDYSKIHKFEIYNRSDTKALYEKNRCLNE